MLDHHHKGENMNCKCGKELTDVKVEIELAFNVERLNENGTWEPIPNSIAAPREIMCMDCFSTFVDVIDDTFNKES